MQQLRGRVVTLAVLPMTLVMFGLAAWFIALPDGDPLRPPILEAAGLAIGVPVFLTGIGEAIVLRRAVPVLFANPEAFGRAIAGVVIPQATALFAFALSFLILVNSPVGPSGVAAANLAAYIMSAGGLGAPAAGILFHRIWKPETSATWVRAISFAGAASYSSVAAFALSFLSLQAA